MKLSTKLVLSFSAVILLVGGIGITFSLINEAVKDQVTTESQQAIEEIDLAGEMGIQLYRSLTRAQYLLEDKYRQSLSPALTRGSMSNEVVHEQINRSLKQFQSCILETRKLTEQGAPAIFGDTTVAPEVRAQLHKLEEKFETYTQLIRELQDLSSENYADGKEFFTVTIEPFFRTTMLPLIEEFQEEIQASHKRKIAGLNEKLAQIGNILAVATFFALMIAISLTFFLYRSIANPIKELANAAQDIGRGNLQSRIDYESQDELGKLGQIFNHMAENLSQTTVSRDYVDSIIESMADLLIVTDQQHRITRINSAGLTITEFSEEQLRGKKVGFLFSPEGEPSEHIQDRNMELVTRSGDRIPVSVSKGVINRQSEEVKGYVFVASDISSEKEAQEKITQSLKEKEVLLAEIHHRVKNNLAVISGLLQMQIWETENEFAASALQESQLRVQSIALVHEKLYQSESLSYIEFDKYLQDLVETIRSTYLEKDSPVEIVADLEPVVLSVNQAISCSLLVNELVANTFKHAFDEEEAGKVSLTMTKVGDKVDLMVKNDGKKILEPDSPALAEMLGMSLVDTLTKQLNGEKKVCKKNGAEIVITFKIQEYSSKNFSTSI